MEYADLMQDREEVVKMACGMLAELDVCFPGTVEKTEAVAAGNQSANEVEKLLA